MLRQYEAATALEVLLSFLQAWTPAKQQHSLCGVAELVSGDVQLQRTLTASERTRRATRRGRG